MLYLIKIPIFLGKQPLNLSSSDEEPKVSFSELLKGVNPKKDDKFVQNGVVSLF